MNRLFDLPVTRELVLGTLVLYNGFIGLLTK